MVMIPTFPKFKKLELTDKEEVEKITSKFSPYSDFNFVSMWSWDIKGEMRISQLNNNLVVLLTDYLTGKPFFSFLGDNKISETIFELILFSKKNFQVNLLKLIPEEVVAGLKKTEFQILPDLDSHDYIYSVDKLCNMHKWSKHKSSKGIEKFLELHSDYLVKISAMGEIQKNECKKMFKKWATNKNIDDHFGLNEYKAFERFLEIKDENIEIVSLYKDNQLIGFSAYEIISRDYAVSHFAKADKKHHSAIYDILNWEEAKLLSERGVKYYNWEQDLGIENLRKSKISYCPVNFLKKYKVSLINK